MDARRKSRTLRTEIDVPNPEGKLRAGLYVNATIIVDEHLNVLTVPSTALVRADSRTFCVSVTDGRVGRTPVTSGLNDGTLVEGPLRPPRDRDDRQGQSVVAARRSSRRIERFQDQHHYRTSCTPTVI